MAVIPEVSVAGPPPVPVVRLPSSFDSMLSTLAGAEQAIARVAADIRVMVEAQSRASTDFAKSVEDNKQVMKSIEQALKDSVDAQQVLFDTSSGRSSGRTLRDIAPSSARRKKEVDAYEQAQRDYARAKSQPFATMREDMFGRLAQNLSSQQQGFIIDPSGTVRTAGGQFVGADDAARITRLNRAATFSQDFAESGAQSAILKQFPQLAGAMKMAGVAGAVVGGVQVATNQLESQREEARQYQQALGVGNVEAQRQRLGQFAFRTSMMGTMSDTQANRLFDEVTGLGMTGERREAATGFAVDTFRQFGMDTAQSMALIRVANQRGVESFESLKGSLEGVTEAAAASGMSANVARDNFVSLYTTLSGSISQAGATAISAGLATAGAQLGPTFQNLGFSGVLDEDMIRTMAVQLRMSYNEMSAALGDPTQAAGIFERRGEIVRDRLGNFVTDDAARISTAFATDKGGIEQLTSTDFRNLGRELMQANAVPDAALLRQVYEFETGRTTTGLTDEQVVGLVMMETMGTGQDFQVAESIRQNIADAQAFDIDTSSRFGVYQELFGDNEIKGRGLNPFSDLNRDVRRRQQIASEYTRTVDRRDGVAADPIVAQLIQQSKASDMFEVSVDGQRRVVDLRTLITQFPDKIMDGSAVRASGSSRGQSVGDIYGFGTREVASEIMSGIDEEARMQAGIDYDEHLSALSAEEGAIAGRVYVEPTPRLAQYLSFFESGTLDEKIANTNMAPYGYGS